uniref:Protein kinase domain-containing protein n=1 Tax=Panagrolaimus sp. ES5 TaxID=591445 RepID=A0AC34FZC4_9BILA
MAANMDTIYEENTDNNSGFIAPAAPRKILCATRSQKRSSQSDENVIKSERRAVNQSSVKHELTLAQKVEIRVDRLEVVRVLGEGAFGEVVLVVDKDDH